MQSHSSEAYSFDKLDTDTTLRLFHSETMSPPLPHWLVKSSIIASSEGSNCPPFLDQSDRLVRCWLICALSIVLFAVSGSIKEAQCNSCAHRFKIIIKENFTACVRVCTVCGEQRQIPRFPAQRLYEQTDVQRRPHCPYRASTRALAKSGTIS